MLTDEARNLKADGKELDFLYDLVTGVPIYEAMKKEELD